jgi:HEAT repeat protein
VIADPAIAEAAVQSEVDCLLNLHEGPRAVSRIVSLGERAIPALERVLRGPSQALYHSRCWAADALAAIGGPAACQALIRALNDSAHRTPSPVAQEAEDTVV